MTLPIWLWLPTLLQTLLAACLCFVPLFDLLGYEFCFASCLLAAITGPLVGLGAGGANDYPSQALRQALLAAVAHLLPGLLLISLNASRVRNCNYLAGLLFFVLLPVASALYGSTLGVLVARLLVGARAGLRHLVLALAVVVPLGLALYGLYAEPPIFVYNHLWGYFAGSLYDENVGVDARLLIFRGGTLVRLVAMAAVTACWERWARLGTGLVLSTLLLSVGAATAYDRLLGPSAGYRVDRAQIAAALPTTLTRPGLVVHLPASVEPARAEAIADDHAFRLEALEARLQVTPEGPVHSFVYADAAQKARLMGGRGTMISKPWLREIHVHDAVAPHPVMPHELAHAVASSFGSRWLGLSAHHEVLVNMGLVEGLAEAVSPDNDDLSLHAWARAMRQLHLAPDIRGILGPAGFWGQAPRRAYTVAGSFVRYLLDTYGPEPLKAAYAAGNFEEAYGKPLSTLVAGWEAFIDGDATAATATATHPTHPAHGGGGIVVSAKEMHIAAERFRQPSIFARPCAHEIAQLTAAAQASEPHAAVALRRQICAHLGDAPVARMELALALRRAGESDAFLLLAGELLRTGELNLVLQAELLQARSEVMWAQGRQSEAREAARAIIDLDVSLPLERAAWVRLWAMDLEPALGGQVLAFLEGRLGPLPAVLLLDHAAGAAAGDRTYAYLIARQLHRADSPELALRYLTQAGPHPWPAIEAERQRLTGDALWRLGELERATAAFRAYESLASTSGEVAQARDMVARLQWQRGRAAAR